MLDISHGKLDPVLNVTNGLVAWVHSCLVILAQRQGPSAAHLLSCVH